MTDSDVPISGEGEPAVPPPSFDSELASFAGQLCVPKLRASQLIAYLALVVVLIGLDFGMKAMETRTITPVLHGTMTVAASWWTRIIVEFQTASFAVCLVTSGILIRCRCFQTLGKLQPGHWIVLILATGGICGALPARLICWQLPIHHLMVGHNTHSRLSSGLPSWRLEDYSRLRPFVYRMQNDGKSCWPSHQPEPSCGQFR